MQFTIEFNGEITYTREQEAKNAADLITTSIDTHSVVLEGVKMCIDVEEGDTPPTLGDVFADMLAEAFTSTRPKTISDEDPDPYVPERDGVTPPEFKSFTRVVLDEV